jgi:hypothetical protein
VGGNFIALRGAVLLELEQPCDAFFGVQAGVAHPFQVAGLWSQNSEGLKLENVLYLYRVSMFEHYTERAIRVIQFARYEATQLGSRTIETEHLLLGLIREGNGITSRIFNRCKITFEEIRKEIESRIVLKEKISSTIEPPPSPDVDKVLTFAAEEAEHLNHKYIGTEHILIGILRLENCVAA